MCYILCIVCWKVMLKLFERIFSCWYSVLRGGRRWVRHLENQFFLKMFPFFCFHLSCCFFWMGALYHHQVLLISSFSICFWFRRWNTAPGSFDASAREERRRRNGTWMTLWIGCPRIPIASWLVRKEKPGPGPGVSKGCFLEVFQYT